jgi:hypothetical protein
MEMRARGGSSLGGYRLHECLGYSSGTAVYRALGEMGAQWALKVIDPQLDLDGRLSERLKRDADLLSRLDHPSIPPIYETGREDHVTFATSPLIEATTIADLMAGRALDLELAWTTLNQLADALDRAHRLGLSHRGIKPNNILIDPSGRAYLVEFGVSSPRIGPAALRSPGYRLRFAQYLAPEQIEGAEPDGRTDVYATAVLVFEILTGTSLFPGAPVEDVLRMTLEPRGAPGRAESGSLPPTVSGVLRRALSRDPRDRQRTAYELIEDLIALPGPREARRASPGGSSGEGAVADPDAIAAPAPESALATLRRMGVPTMTSHDLPILNQYVAGIVRFTKEIAGSRAPSLLEAAGLERYVAADPPADGKREGTAAELSRLADAFEAAYGAGAPAQMRALGRAVTAEWVRTTQPRPHRAAGRAEAKITDILHMSNAGLDRVRGEELHAWKQIDKGQFWVVHHANLFAAGRRRVVRSCHYWVGAFEAVLRWGGLAGWTVEEAEFACVTGAGACVFTVERVATG